MVLTLLELAFSHILDFTHQEVYINQKYGIESVYHDIYNKIVKTSRRKIQNYLHQKNSKIILRSIYILRTEDMFNLTLKMLGPLQDYRGSLFRLATVYGVITFVESNTINEILLDIIDMSDMILPDNHPYRNNVHEELKVIANCRDNNLPVDIMMIINCYMAFGYFLYPYIILI